MQYLYSYEDAVAVVKLKKQQTKDNYIIIPAEDYQGLYEIAVEIEEATKENFVESLRKSLVKINQ